MKGTPLVVLIGILLELTISCSKATKPKTPQLEELPPVPPPDPPTIEVEEPPRPRRVEPRTVPLPAPEVETPVEPGYVLGTYRCYEGNPKRSLTHIKTIKKEDRGWFRRDANFLYDCHGTNTCLKQFMLRKTQHGAFDSTQYCYEHFEDQNIFSLCREVPSKPISTHLGNMYEVTGIINGTPLTFYCETSLPL